MAVWLDGGWSVSRRRQDDDLDAVVDLGEVDALKRELGKKGFAVAVDELPTRLEMKDAQGRCVGLHTVTFDDEGGGTQMQQSGKAFRYPPEGFTGVGEVGGQIVGRQSQPGELLLIEEAPQVDVPLESAPYVAR